MRRFIAISVCFASLSLAGAAYAADFLIDPKEIESVNGAVASSTKSSSKASQTSGRGLFEYRVKADENVHLILVKKFGYSDDEADVLSEKVMRLNGIQDNKRLKSGDVIFIPRRKKG